MRRGIKITFLLFFFVAVSCHKNNTPPINPISIGQTYAGGIVFYVDSTGKHGLVCAPYDQNNSIIWGDTFFVNLPVDTALNTGRANTTAIVSILGPGNYAAYICDTLTLNGYNDWYLPSIDELNFMMKHLAARGLGNFTNGFYWSSSYVGTIYYTQQSIVSYAWTEDIVTYHGSYHDSYQDFGEFSEPLAVRAARAF